eukprot:5218823-Pyramimonas_sp.AAC.1
MLKPRSTASYYQPLLRRGMSPECPCLLPSTANPHSQQSFIEDQAGSPGRHTRSRSGLTTTLTTSSR